MPKKPGAKPEVAGNIAVGAEDYDIVHHKRHKRKNEVAELNLTSMIDVVFQLLIYFILTVNFVVDEGVLITQLPDVPDQQVEEPPKDPMIVALRGSYGDVAVTIDLNNQRIASFTELQMRLEELQFNEEKGRTGPFDTDYPVRIEPSEFVRWQHVLNAFNAVLQADYENVGFPQSAAR